AQFPLAGGGASRVVVIDGDGPEGRAALAELPPLPLTRTHRTGRTGGGEHLFYRVPDEWDLEAVKDSNGKIGPHIDVKRKGYVVAPPSMHHTGTQYTVADDAPIAEMPRWLYDRIAPAK